MLKKHWPNLEPPLCELNHWAPKNAFQETQLNQPFRDPPRFHHFWPYTKPLFLRKEPPRLLKKVPSFHPPNGTAHQRRFPVLDFAQDQVLVISGGWGMMRIFFTRDPEASPDWLEGGYKPASQPTNHFDLTSHLHLPNLPPPPPPPHLTPEAPTEPPSHLIRREGGFRPAHVRAGQAFEAQISRGARVNFHSLKARIFFAGKHGIGKTFLAWLVVQVAISWLWNQLLSRSGSSNGVLPSRSWVAIQESAKECHAFLLCLHCRNKSQSTNPRTLTKSHNMSFVSFSTIPCLTGNWQHLRDFKLTWWMCKWSASTNSATHHTRVSNAKFTSMATTCSNRTCQAAPWAWRKGVESGRLWNTWRTLHVVLKNK